MNYYKQIAEMLGVELGEEFSLKGKYTGNIVNARYKFTQEKGLMCSHGGDEWSRSNLMVSIIDGIYSVVKLPWKPKKSEQYWYYDDGDGAECTRWNNFNYDYYTWKLGNCFRTEEEAETKGKEIMEKLVKEYEEA